MIPNLLTWKGTVNRKEYALAGIALVAIKYNMDRMIAAGFHQSWYFYSYLIPPAAARSPGKNFYLALVLAAIPFVWIGTVLTVRRLRSAGLHPALVMLFFVPFANLLFFLILMLLPATEPIRVKHMPLSRKGTKLLDSLIPTSSVGSAILAFVINISSAFLFVKFSTEGLSRYGDGLFIGLPFCLGFTSVLIYSYHAHRSLGSCLIVSLVSIGLVGAALFVAAVEGLLCILMAAPLAAFFAMIGGALGYAVQFHPASKREMPHIYLMMMIGLSVLMAVEDSLSPPASVFETKSAVEVNAPIEQVWSKVISFPELGAPKEWFFKAGIAYPVSAKIEGEGAGALRHCNFSTGSFTEPIEVWKAPEMLKFQVSSNPFPMNEWTWRSRIEPPHLKGFFVSQGGQFSLKSLGRSRTLLEGTTWYQHHMQPEFYWKLWCNLLIHRIHLRVLDHVRSLSEAQVKS